MCTRAGRSHSLVTLDQREGSTSPAGISGRARTNRTTWREDWPVIATPSPGASDLQRNVRAPLP